MSTCGFNKCDNRGALKPILIMPGSKERGEKELRFQLDLQVCHDCANREPKAAFFSPEGWQMMMDLIEETNRKYQQRFRPLPVCDCSIEFETPAGIIARIRKH